MSDVYVGRQPIFDADLNVVGYELLYRSANMDRAEFSDGNMATSAVISNAFLEIGLDRLVGDKLAFINLTRPFLLGEYPIPLRHDRLVLEVLEDITVDDELLGALTVLSKEGFTLALDDVVDPKSVDKILGIANIVKVDLLSVDRLKLPMHVQYYKRKNVKLLAEKIETQREFEMCKKLGFELFQGYFLCKPNVVKEKKITGIKMTILRLLAELQTPNIEFSRIDDIIRQDVTLSYKLLRLINSAYYARITEIKSIRQALTLLGLRQIRSWISLLLLSEAENKPPELMITAMIRGKMCETMARALKVKNPEVQFTVGLFSVLDAIMDMPLQEILSQVPLSKEVQLALLSHEGELGDLLKCVLAYEKGEWADVGYKNLSADTISDAYLEAVDWSTEVNKVLTSKP